MAKPMEKPKMSKALCKATQTKDALEIYIYDDICAKRFDWSTWEEVESETGAKHIADLIASAGDVKQINVHINSYGGYIDQAVAIYTNLTSAAATVTVYIDGVACSAASLIAMAGNPVIMGKCSMMMIHNPWTVATGNAQELRKTADDLDKMTKVMRLAYLTKAADKLNEEQLIELLEAETWLTAEECVNFGLCDEIVDKTENETDSEEEEETDSEEEENSNSESETDTEEEADNSDSEDEEETDSEEEEEEKEKSAAKAAAGKQLSVFQKMVAAKAAAKKISNFERLKFTKK